MNFTPQTDHARSANRLGVALLAIALAATCWLLAALAGSVARAAVDTCPNAGFRTGYSADLPDCRAYELVSPPGSRPYISSTLSVSFTQASATGNGIAWFSWYPIPGAESSGFHYLSTRGSTGWSTVGAIPPQSPTSSNLFACLPSIYFSPDLSRGVLSDGFDAQGSNADGECGGDDPMLVEGEPQGTRNLFLHDSGGGPHQLLIVTDTGALPTSAQLGTPPANAEFQAGSSDFSHIVFEDEAQLTPGAPGGIGLYEWSGGAVRLVSVLPDGTPVAGTIGNSAEYVGPGAVGIGPGGFQGAAPFTGGVSSDGSRVFFEADGDLYLRENADQPQSPISGGVCTDPADACTVQVDASQASGPGGGGTFGWASADGSEVYFTDDAVAGLTSDTVSGSGENLYRYDVGTGHLTDLTPSGDAEVQGVSGVSEDGSFAYFVANGALSPGAAAGQPNLYLSHGGATTFIATLDPGDSSDWSNEFLTARVSSSGRFAAFNSVKSLTGYDNTETSPEACGDPTVPGDPCTQIYLYDASANDLTCVSCNPSGVRPTGGTTLLPTTQMTNTPAAAHLSRVLTDEGRVFFDSPDPLVPGASNGLSNVFEFEPDGVGRCAQAPACLHLISSGRSDNGSFLYDASSGGDDVFFVTTQKLLGDGTDGQLSIYDARVAGGFPTTATPPPPCTGDSCKGSPPPPPAEPSPGSSLFSGPGNQGRNLTPGRSTKKSCKRIANKRKRKKCLKKAQDMRREHKHRVAW
jgi:hypothetical protein